MAEVQVSAVIPSYNSAGWVCDAVEGALAQRGVTCEVIVVDDGSKDDTRERLLPYGDRIRYIHRENGGLSAARNTGIQAARGEWIGLLDADDRWHPDKSRVQLEGAARLGEVGFVGSPRQERELEPALPPDPPVIEVGVRDFLTWTPMMASSALIRRTCLDAVGLFDESLRSVEDRDMWLRLSARYRAAQVKSPCFFYRTHPGQMSHNAKRMHENYVRVLEKFFREHPEHEGLADLAWGKLFYDTAWTYSAQGDRRVALEFLLKSFRRHLGDVEPPTPYGRTKLLVRLLLGERLFGTVSRIGQALRS